MFTGIIEETGTIAGMERQPDSIRLTVRADKVLENTIIGDSIAVNGVCLTVTSMTSSSFCADVMHETMRRSSFKDIRNGSTVNLERAVAVGGRLGGHIVSGRYGDRFPHSPRRYSSCILHYGLRRLIAFYCGKRLRLY